MKGKGHSGMNFQQNYDIESIYRAYYQDVYRYVLFLNYNPSVVEDIVQNTFLKAMTGIAGFRGDSQIKTWLLSIARNESIRYSQKEKYNYSLDEVPEPVSMSGIAESYCNKETVSYILEYIKKCPEPKKSLLILRIMDELSFVEIGKILGKTDTWCRVTFLRLKNELLKDCEVSNE